MRRSSAVCSPTRGEPVQGGSSGGPDRGGREDDHDHREDHDRAPDRDREVRRPKRADRCEREQPCLRVEELKGSRFVDAQRSRDLGTLERGSAGELEREEEEVEGADELERELDLGQSCHDRAEPGGDGDARIPMPADVPMIWGTVARNPNWSPEAHSRALFGPGVTELTKANRTRASRGLSCH